MVTLTLIVSEVKQVLKGGKSRVIVLTPQVDGKAYVDNKAIDGLVVSGCVEVRIDQDLASAEYAVGSLHAVSLSPVNPKAVAPVEDGDTDPKAPRKPARA